MTVLPEMMPRSVTQEFFRTIQEVARAPRPAAMLEVLTGRLGALFGAAHCACIGISEDRRHARLLAVDGNPMLRDVVVDLFRYPEAVEAAVTGRTVYAPEVLRDRLFLTHLAQWPDAPEAHEVESVAAVPLVTPHNTRVIVIRTRRGDIPLTAEHIALLEQLVGAAAILLEREERLALAVRRQSDSGKLDALTRCPGLEALDRRLREELERVRRYRSHLAFALLDFAPLAQAGHASGNADRLFAELGALLLAEVRAPDFVARYHGPEFALLLPSTGVAEARPVLLRIASRVSSLAEAATLRPPTFTAGLVGFPEPGLSRAEDILAAAETALIRGKTGAPDGVGTLGTAA